MVLHILSKTGIAYVQGTKDFTKAQQRVIRWRLNKKLRLLGISGGVSELCRGFAKNWNGQDNLLSSLSPGGGDRALVAQLAEQRLTLRNKSPRGDSNP